MLRRGFLVACFLTVPAAFLAAKPQWTRESKNDYGASPAYDVSVKNGILIIENGDWQAIGSPTKSGWYAVKWRQKYWENDSQSFHGNYYVTKDLVTGFYFSTSGKVFEKYVRQKPHGRGK